MFDMSGVSGSGIGQALLSSSPSTGSLIKMSNSPCPSSTLSPNISPNTTPTNQLLHNQQHHLLNSHAIKKEVGLLNSPGSNENMNTSNEVFNSKCKRKINFSHLGIPPRGHQPATVARRNARERNRVKQVNNGFQALKQHIPLGHRSKKMSKVETLRCAVDYIKNLKTLLDPNDSGSLSAEALSFDTHQFQFDFGVSSGSGSTQQLSPTSSDDPSSPSYASEGSYVTSAMAPTALYDYENYEPVSPEDEELLDAISFWQQS